MAFAPHELNQHSAFYVGIAYRAYHQLPVTPKTKVKTVDIANAMIGRP